MKPWMSWFLVALGCGVVAYLVADDLSARAITYIFLFSVPAVWAARKMRQAK